jgi:hypothetical protein
MRTVTWSYVSGSAHHRPELIVRVAPHVRKLACLLFALTLLNCESTNFVPPVTSQMAATRKGQHVDLAMLREGRTLLVHRCIECHTLPPLWHYRIEDWPEIVDSMSHRASLKPAERDAVVAYIIAVRATAQ